MAVQPQFEDTFGFSGNRALVGVGDKIGYIDQAGTLVIPAVYSNMSAGFSEGLALASETPGHWGLLGENGNWEIQPIYEDGRPFSEGLAAVKTGGKWGFIGKSGNFVIKRSTATPGASPRVLLASRWAASGAT